MGGQTRTGTPVNVVASTIREKSGYGCDFDKTPASYFRWGDEKPSSFTFDCTKVGLTGTYHLRDVWRQQDLGIFPGSFNSDIRHHGVVRLRAFPKKINE
ncbi:hypothetical protein [Fibrella forsythiae]|uniref:Alpha galactosidase C-terminal domain-containing protein n=1 Tax=Fibrella forsythiae TaxID=2817061 RepID=A0ABS3JM34_9BACT|nr:hypothetical protein [Fibrella forsythiae]MBO0950518.1 hypothetical protein [Fibrella forsythiae]